MAEEFKGTISRDGDYAVIRVPLDQIHGLRVALAPGGYSATKSTATQDIRDRLLRGLAKLESRGS